LSSPSAKEPQEDLSHFASLVERPQALPQAVGAEAGDPSVEDPLSGAPPLPQGVQGPARLSSQSGPVDDADPGIVPRRDPRKDDDLDPLARHAAQLAPPVLSTASLATDAAQPGPSAVLLQARASLEEVLPALVRRIAWSGDARRGTMRLELGAGRLAGATLVVHADDGRVRVEISAPPGVDTASWQERIAARLRERGVALDGVEAMTR
jgi:hypothetical protein